MQSFGNNFFSLSPCSIVMQLFGNKFLSLSEEENIRKKSLLCSSEFKQTQKQDLERQIKELRLEYPHLEILSEIGSGILFKKEKSFF